MDTSRKMFRPTFKSSNSQKLYEKAVREYEHPDEAWTLYNVKILGVYEAYEVALKKLRLAEIQSDLNTDDEDTRKKSRSIRKKIIASSSDDEEGEEDDVSFPKPPSTRQIEYGKPSANEWDDCPTPKSQPLRAMAGSSLSTTSSPFFEKVQDCCTCCCKFDKEYKRKMEQDMSELKSQMKLVIQVLREQGRQQLSSNDDDEVPPTDDFEEKLPIKSLDQLDAWEKKINSKEEQKRMVAFLARIGGRDINGTVKNILKKVFSDAVAAQYNWEGKKGKKMLSSLIISECIKKAAAKNPNTKATEQEIITSIRNWLRHATARLNNKNKIQDKNNNQQDEDRDEPSQ